MAIACPRCGAPTWPAVHGRICVDCGWSADTTHRCPACGRPTRLRLDGRLGQWCEHCSMDVTPVAAEMREAPYRSPTHALYSLIWATAQASGAPSELGPKLERMEMGYVQTSGRRQISREHEILGELVVPWSRLDGEDQVLLWEWGSSNMWLEQAVRCVCGREYVPAWLRLCSRCGKIRPQDELMCSCGASDWKPTEACPKCGKRDTNLAATRAVRVARVVSEYRMGVFVQDHGRRPLRKGESENEAENFDEGSMVGYCWRCHRWMSEGELMQGRRCRVCHQRIRWGVNVSARAIEKMVPHSSKRWRDLLEERGLI